MYKMDNTNKEIHGNFANKYTHDRNIYYGRKKYPDPLSFITFIRKSV